MKKGFLSIGLGIVSLLLFSFLMNGDEDQRGRNKENQRQIVERILEAYNVKFNKEAEPTVMVFQLDPADSVQIVCPDCMLNLPSEDNTKGTLRMYLRSRDATYELQASDFEKWIKVKSSNGKLGLVFERDGFGEKNLLVRQVKMWRKTRTPYRDVASEPMPWLDVNSLYIDKLVKDAAGDQTRFALNMKSLDQIIVDIKGINGAAPGNLVCNQYKEGEEWDKTPVAIGAPVPLPEVDGGKDRFFYEFSHIEGIKGVNTYHIDVTRIPAYTTGYLDEVDSTGTDTLNADTVLSDEPVDPFLKYLELMQGDPDFTCTTPESKLTRTVEGRLVLGPEKQNKMCVDLELTDECVAAEECVGCDSIWAFWIGAGENVINRYNYKDSTRKLSTGEGLIEAWARSRRFRGMSSSSIFPEVFYGEDIFFAIVDREETERFLNADLSSRASRIDWYGDYTYTISPALYKTSFSYILQYNPERPVSLCMCNDNAVTSVPVMFRFQQFLTEPKNRGGGVQTNTATVGNEGF